MSPKMTVCIVPTPGNQCYSGDIRQSETLSDKHLQALFGVGVKCIVGE